MLLCIYAVSDRLLLPHKSSEMSPENFHDHFASLVAIHSQKEKREQSHDDPNQPRRGPLRAIPAAATGPIAPDSMSMSLPCAALTTVRRRGGDRGQPGQERAGHPPRLRIRAQRLLFRPTTTVEAGRPRGADRGSPPGPVRRRAR